MSLSAVASLALMVGWQRPLAVIFLMVGWLYSATIGQFYTEPFVAQLLIVFLALAFVPRGEPFSIGETNPEWDWSSDAHAKLTAIVASVCLIAGLSSLLCSDPFLVSQNASEIQGASFRGVRTFSESPVMTQVVAWGYVMCFFVVFFPSYRFWAWAGLLALQGWTQVSAGQWLAFGAVLALHLVLLDGRWISPSPVQGRRAPIVFFDGVCGLCNWAVDFILSEDRDGRFVFTSIQGEIAAKMNNETLTSGHSMALLDGQELVFRTDAALAIASQLGGVWRCFSLLRIIPRPLRDGVYWVVQKNRYRWFGRLSQCRLPSQKNAERFLP